MMMMIKIYAAFLCQFLHIFIFFRHHKYSFPMKNVGDEIFWEMFPVSAHTSTLTSPHVTLRSKSVLYHVVSAPDTEN
jgi:hypothetical protein